MGAVGRACWPRIEEFSCMYRSFKYKFAAPVLTTSYSLHGFMHELNERVSDSITAVLSQHHLISSLVREICLCTPKKAARREYLSNTNESATVPVSQKFLELNKALGSIL